MGTYEFCPHTEDRRRCVAGDKHDGPHDLQPVHSVSVRTIERREADLRALGYDRP